MQYRLDGHGNNVTPGEVVALNGELVLVDLRPPAEFAAGHGPGAINVPLEAIETGWKGIDGRLPFVTVCRTGEVASRAATLLRASGRDAFAVIGGMVAWVASGESLVTNSAELPRLL